MISAFAFGGLLDTYSPGRLIQVIQGCAVVTIVLNGIALWKQEPRNRERAMTPAAKAPGFMESWQRLSARPGTLRLLVVIALGTAGFGMADVLMEPFGGQVLQMSVAQTTKLTIVLAFGSLVGFGLASRWLGRGAQPVDVAALGATIGVPAFCLVILSAVDLSIPMLIVGTLIAGFGAGLFGHGTLTATMRAAPRDQIGLALGAWGAVQTTAAGIAIAVGGVIRDTIAFSHAAGGTVADAYVPVFAVEAGLLVLALIAAYPLLRNRLKTDQGRPLPDQEVAEALRGRLGAQDV
jgi:MFS transporter, BCD family, chlorophyll transporter